jgi:hypothetical protein
VGGKPEQSEHPKKKVLKVLKNPNIQPKPKQQFEPKMQTIIENDAEDMSESPNA